MSLFSKLSAVFGSSTTPIKASKAKAKPAVAPVTERKKIPVEPIKPGRSAKTVTPTPPVAKTPTAPVSTPHSPAISASLKEIQDKAREVILEARSEAMSIREKAEDEAKRARQSLSDQQRSLDQKLSALEQKLQSLDKKEGDVEQMRTQLQENIQEVQQQKTKILSTLESVSQMTTGEAKELLLKTLETKLKGEMSVIVRQKQEEAKQIAQEKAREIIVEAMKHGATEYVPEYTVSVVKIADEEVKGRIIGKGGRNIHTFERATGVDVDLDGSPSEVRLSCFDPIRREVAKIALQTLVKDGRIQPTRIEEVVTKVSKDMDKIIFEEGKRLCHNLGVYNLPNELLTMIGKYKFHFVNGQNMAAHTMQQTKIGVKLAQEMGANSDIVRLGCVLQDIGKVVMDTEGNHVELGVRALKRFNMPQAVIDCVAQHEEQESFTGVEQVLVHIADKITSSRPGASYEEIDEHVARLEKLEQIALSYEAVGAAYAIQAGREVRVILNPEKSKDDDVIALSQAIKDQIQNEMAYPGTVKITVIRQNRAQKVAH